MLPPVWCASHVVGEKPSQAAWDRPWVPWEGCRPRRAFPATWLMPNRWHGGWLPAAVPPVGVRDLLGRADGHSCRLFRIRALIAVPLICPTHHQYYARVLNGPAGCYRFLWTIDPDT